MREHTKPFLSWHILAHGLSALPLYCINSVGAFGGAEKKESSLAVFLSRLGCDIYTFTLLKSVQHTTAGSNVDRF